MNQKYWALFFMRRYCTVICLLGWMWGVAIPTADCRGGDPISLSSDEGELARAILDDGALGEVLELAGELVRSGFNAGTGYREVWIRDLATFIELACEVHETRDLRESLLTFFRFQGEDGNIIDGYVPRSQANVSYRYRQSSSAPEFLGHKNTVETDQESSLIQAVRIYVEKTGDRSFLEQEVQGRTVRQGLELALEYLLKHRFDQEHGLLWGATTVDWGDVQPEHSWGVELDENSHRAIDIYDNAMFVIAVEDLIALVADEPEAVTRWKSVEDEFRAGIRRHLWDVEKQKFRPHIYLNGSPFPSRLDEDLIYYHGGTAVAIQAELLTREEIRHALDRMRQNVIAVGAGSIGLTVYPPYPEGSFKNPGMRPFGYQNGGDWTWFGARAVQGLIEHGFVGEAYRELEPMLQRVRENKGFFEWYDVYNQPRGSGAFRGAAGVLGKAILMLQEWAREQSQEGEVEAFKRAKRSAKIAGYSLSKVQRWLHEVALPKIDPKSGLYISHSKGSGRYRSLWNYDDAAADTYPFLFWAAYYTDRALVDGPILDVLKAEQRLGNHLDRIPTAVNHETLEKEIRSKDDLIFAASEYVKDGLIAIVEVVGKNNPWFERMRGIEDDIWKHADIDTPYGKIPTRNLEANGEQIQALTRLYSMTGDDTYLEWAERLADYYLLPGNFAPPRLRDHGCEIVGGLGLLLGVESVHKPEKARLYFPHVQTMLEQILNEGTNSDGMMFNMLGQRGALSDGWGYDYVTFLCHDMVAPVPLYRDHLRQTLRNLEKPEYRNYPWEGQSIDGYADSIEGGIYLLNRLPVSQGLEWVDREMAANVTRSSEPLKTAKLWGTYKLESNGVRTVLIHALMHTRGIIARPWRQDLLLGASVTGDGVAVVVEAEKGWSGRLDFDVPRHRVQMGFRHDWPRMNTMPEWFTVDPGEKWIVEDMARGTSETYTGAQLHKGLSLELLPGEERTLLIKR